MNPSEPNLDKRFDDNRFFLKDTIRQQIDFSKTEQSRRLPPPSLQKACPTDAPRIELPPGAEVLTKICNVPVGEAILSRESRRDFIHEPIDLDELAALLWATQGVRGIINSACALRTVPSAGARHAFETYIAASQVSGLSPGIYRFLPFDNQLARLSMDERVGIKAASACLGQRFIADAAIVFFWTTIPARMEWRYDMAAHKVIALDAGHVCQNLYLACESMGLGTCAIAAYDQEGCDRLLGVYGEEEFTIYIAPVGKPLNYK